MQVLSFLIPTLSTPHAASWYSGCMHTLPQRLFVPHLECLKLYNLGRTWGILNKANLSSCVICLGDAISPLPCALAGIAHVSHW
jgi:hypothetical protein